MLYLYDKNTIDFTNNGEPIRHSYDEHVIREDGFYLTFKLLLDINSDYKKVKKEMIVSAETPDGRNQFRVYDIVKRKDHVEVVAVQLMYDLDNKMVNPFKVNNVSGTTVINRFISSFKSSLGAFTLSSSVAETHDFSTNDENDDTPSQNALEVLNRITNRWDSELLVNGYDIRMIKRLGTRTNALLYEKKNISNFEEESTVRNMATRIHATSRFIAEGDDEETVISVSVDSPLINEYAQVYEKSFVNNDARTTQELVNWVNLKYSTENIDKPKRNINVSTNIIDGTEINYGDELVLKYLVHDVDEVIRCVGYDYNPVAQTYYSITLGGWKDSFATTLTGGIVDVTQRQVNQIKKNVTHILMNADGYHRNAYGPESVPNPINGDVWYYFEWERPNEIEMRIFEDGFWVPVPFGTKAEVEAAISEAESAKQTAENAYVNAVAEAGNLVEAETTRVDAIIETVNADILNVKNNADSALASIDTAITNAGFTSLDATLADITSIGNQAKADANTALYQAQSAVAVVGGVSGRITTVENSVDNINGVLVNKVSTVDFNNLTGRVGIAETAITQHDSAISLRATKTEAQGYAKGAVDGLEIGGRNYFKNYDGRENSVSNSTTAEHYVYPSNSGTLVAIELEPNTTYTMSGQFKVNVATDRTLDMFFVHSPVSGAPQHRSSAVIALTTKYVKHQFTFTTGDNPSQRGYGRFDLNASTDSALITMFAKFLKLEKGNKATDWSPAPEDVDVAISTVQSNLTVEAGKISAVTARVGVTESSIASVKQTADGNSATVANHAGQISTINQTVSGLQTIVADKVSTAQFTVLSNSVSSVVTGLNNLEIGGRNLFENTKTMSNMPYLYAEKYGAFSTVSTKPTGGYLDTYTYRTPILEGLEYTVSFYAKADVNMSMACFFYSPNTTTHAVSSTGQTSSSPDGSMVVFVTTEWKRYWVTWKQSKDGDTKSVIVGRNSSTNRLFIAGVQFEKGNKVTDWTPAPEDQVTQTQFTQTVDSFNARIVEKGNVVAQFNMDNGTTLISNKKLLLDANTYIMGTTFVNDLKAKSIEAVNANIASIRASILTADVITSGMVATSTALITKIFATDATVTTLTGKTAFINSIKAINISADRITAGTLNAANVNIINLNVSKLTGNITTFVQSSWNTINSTVSITGDGIVSSNSVGRFIHYTNGGLVFGGGGERTVLRNNTGANPNRSGISLEPVGSNLNALDLDIATRGTSSFHMGTSDLDQGYRLRLSNDDFNTNNYYISLKTGTKFDFRLNSNNASGTNKNNLEIEVVDSSGTVRVGKNAGYGSSMYIVGDDVIFAKGGTSNRVPVYASLFAGRAFNYIEGNNVYSVQKTISAILGWIGSAVKWQTS